jgi:2-amino-4-hydroxy-6-hydroxymethyldihydropteridine diphosphokinase
MMKKVFLGLGSNIGSREDYLRQAIEKIRELIGPVIRISSAYETGPWGFQSENQFLNIVAEIETGLKPSGLLGRLLMIESLLGRLRDGKGYTSRTIDIDILLYGKMIIDQGDLKVPHERMHERRFVLIPLAEIAPDIIHPVFKKSISELLSVCADKSKVILYGRLTG